MGLVRLSISDEEYLRMKRELELENESEKSKIADINRAALQRNSDDAENISPSKTRRPNF